WWVARDKNNVPQHKRKLNFWLANVELAIGLTMFATTGIAFIAVKLSAQVNQDFLYQVYFWTWLLFSTYYIIRRNINKTNRETLLLGSIIAFIIPIVNGVISKKWIWNNL